MNENTVTTQFSKLKKTFLITEQDISNEKTRIFDETIPINPEFDIEKMPIEIFEYYFVLHKFKKPIEKNFQSIKIILKKPISTKYSIYVSIYANNLKLSTTRKLKYNVEEEILQMNYLPAEITPDIQYKLIAHVKNMSNVTIDSQHVFESLDLLDVLELKMKYCYFKEPENIKELEINCYNDEQILKLKNGSLYMLRRY